MSEASDRRVVTVIVPARNEAADIEACLDAVLAQTWPHDRLEVVVVDGASTDDTRDRARRRLEGSGLARWAVVENAAATTPSNLNRGLAWAQGDLIARVDARSRIPEDYVERCAEVLEAWPEVAVVGGSQVSRPRPGSGAVARGIARAQRNPYAMGFARYRRRAASGATGTVYLGFFRRDDLDAVGGWDERYATNQDFELNRRLGEKGLVWYLAGLDVGYVPRSTLADLARQYRRFGRAKAAGWLEGGVPVLPRQAVMLAAPPVAALGFLAVVRRRPAQAVAMAVGGALLIDRASGPADDAQERVASLAATAVMAGCWWAGIVEQAAAYARGHRIITDRGTA